MIVSPLTGMPLQAASGGVGLVLDRGFRCHLPLCKGKGDIYRFIILSPFAINDK
jgi:hypothetical protein